MEEVRAYVSFAGNCEEAVQFYVQKLGAEVLFLQRYGESPLAGRGPDEKIMHCRLKIGESIVMVCDNVFQESNPTIVGNNISLSISLDDTAKAEELFEKMSEGAVIVMPMQETFWAVRFGMLTDKFGINWMLNVDLPQAQQKTV